MRIIGVDSHARQQTIAMWWLTQTATRFAASRKVPPCLGSNGRCDPRDVLVWSRRPKKREEHAAGKEQARDNPASGRVPGALGAMLWLRSGRKSFAMCTCKKSVRKRPGMSRYEIIGLKVPWNEHL